MGKMRRVNSDGTSTLNTLPPYPMIIDTRPTPRNPDYDSDSSTPEARGPVAPKIDFNPGPRGYANRLALLLVFSTAVYV